MLRQEELAFIKAMGKLRKAMVASKKKVKNVPAHTRGATTAPERPSAPKKRVENLPTDGATGEPASRRPAPGHLIEGEPDVLGATGERTAQSSRQLGSAEGRLAYATVVTGIASLQMSTANGSASAEPAASPEATFRRLSFEDKSGPLYGMPNGATTHAQVAATGAAPIRERPKKTPILLQVWATPVPSWPGCGPPALAA
jgi:hypothetical protein